MDPTQATDAAPALTLDPGWLFLIAGLALAASAVLIPAKAELDHARWMRDRAGRIEQHRVERLKRYSEFLDGLEQGDQQLVLSLAASQLNKIPADRVAIPEFGDRQPLSASVFPALEPDPVELPEEPRFDSLLYRWATGETSRLWLLGGGALCMLVGLLPAGRRRS